MGRIWGDVLPAAVRDALRSDISEHYLFHGTSPHGALGIYKNGFDARKAGSSMQFHGACSVK